MESESYVTIEARLNDSAELRSFALVDSELGLSSLYDHLRAAFEGLRECALRYIDDEKDIVTIASEADLKAALEIIPSTGNILHLQVLPQATIVAGVNEEKKHHASKYRNNGKNAAAKADRWETKIKRREQRALRKGLTVEGFKLKEEARCKRREERLRRKAERMNEDKKVQEKEKGEEEEEPRRNCRCRGGEKEHHQRHPHPRSQKNNFKDLQFHALKNETGEGWTKWPEGRDQLYLDGNNMLFLTSSLRSLTLHREKRKAEAVLEKVAQAFMFAMQGGIVHSTLIFDNTSTYKEETYSQFSSPVSFRVVSARPGYKTSDDALVDWAKREPAMARRTVYITSDRGLAVQLIEAGGLVVKPKEFLYFANSVMNGEGELDAWLDRIISSL